MRANPRAGLIADAAGDLFGTTHSGGAYFQGEVFEIVKTSTGYASTPTILSSFVTVGAGPAAGLIADATGDLGTNIAGGANDQGTVFEIAKSGFVPRSTTNVVISPLAGQTQQLSSVLTNPAVQTAGRTAGPATG